MKVTVFGPNLSSAAQRKGYFHVHAAGCADCGHYGPGKKYGGERDDFTFEASTRKDIVLALYPPDEFDYDPDADWQRFDDLYLAPCVTLTSDNDKEATVPSKTTKKQLTKTQAEKAVKDNAAEYRLYVAAQIEKKDAKNDAGRKAAEKKMNSHRAGYTAYRNAYRRFKELGGVLRKPAKAAPAKGNKSTGKGKGKSTAKSNKGSQRKNGGPVTETKLSKAAMERRTKDNPMGLTEAQLKAEAEGAPLAQPLGEVISSS